MTSNLHITVACVVEKDGKFLMVEESVGGKVVINQPAGHVEDEESLVEAAIRETHEETGWQVKPVALLSIYRWRHTADAETFFRVAFHAEPVTFDKHRPLDTGIIKAVWLSLDDLAKQHGQLRSPLVLRSIQDYVDNKRYPLDILVDL